MIRLTLDQHAHFGSHSLLGLCGCEQHSIASRLHRGFFLPSHPSIHPIYLSDPRPVCRLVLFFSTLAGRASCTMQCYPRNVALTNHLKLN